MATVFLSYARGDDEPFVHRLYEDLTRRGFDVGFDRRTWAGGVGSYLCLLRMEGGPVPPSEDKSAK